MKDPVPTFTHFITQVLARHPELAYIHAIEPRVDSMVLRPVIPDGWSNDFLRAIWISPNSERRFISAGGYTRDLALEFADTKDDIIAFGRPFISNVRILHFCFLFCIHITP